MKCFLFHGFFLLLDHSANHLAADGAGFLGSQVTIVAFLLVDAQLGRNLSFEAFQCGLRLRNFHSVGFTRIRCHD